MCNKCAYHSKIISCISFRPILNPGPSQCVPLFENFVLSLNLTDKVKVGKSDFSGKNCKIVVHMYLLDNISSPSQSGGGWI